MSAVAAQQQMPGTLKKKQFCEDFSGLSPRSRALAKLRLSALSHDRDRDGSQLAAAFQGRVPRSAFRAQWNKGFPFAKISAAEADAVVGEFDGDGGGVDGSAFLVRFISTGSQTRKTCRLARLSLTQRARDETAAKEMSERLKSVADVTAVAFSARDLEAVQRKLSEASLLYVESGRAGGGGLQGFAGSRIEPSELREQIKNAFALRLTKRELAALISQVSGGHTGSTVNGAMFVNYFLRLGASERRARNERAQSEAEHRALFLEATEARQSELSEIAASVTGVGVGAYLPRDVESAYAKLGHAAVALERNRPTLKPFREGGPIAPREFVRQTRRAFDMDLSTRELNGLIADLEGRAAREGLRSRERLPPGVDSERFLRTVFKTKAQAKAKPRVSRPPIEGPWTTQQRWLRCSTAPGRIIGEDSTWNPR